MKTSQNPIVLTSLALILTIIGRVPGIAQTKAVRTTEKPAIDGVLEDVWLAASRFESFTQIEPDIQAKSSVKTEAYVLYDHENIYVALKLFQQKNTIRANRGRRDADLVKDGDYVTVSLDPLGNNNSAYFFTINAENAVQDGTFDQYGVANTQWDGLFTSAVSISESYWIVELQIPLTSIAFRDKDIQDWGISIIRRYAQNQEVAVNRLVDINSPYRLTNYEKLVGLEGLNKKSSFVITPYVYSHNDADFLQHSSLTSAKAGGEVRYSPVSSMTILATVNPDYAQIETDKEIINVSDLPTEYPEKRPFFTESSDFYTNAAVNTRNIVDIKAGMKIRQLGDVLKYDLTGVLDGNSHLWLTGHTIIGGNETFGEIVGGLKRQPGRDDYNITTHLQKWLFDKRLSLSNWVGTINSHASGKNEWETVNGIRWLTRAFEVAFWSHYKTKFYNPNIVGWNYLSNEFHGIARSKYSLINGAGLFRVVSFAVTYDYFELTSPRGRSYFALAFTNDYTLHLSEYLGNWSLCFVAMPGTNQKFRYRNIANTPGSEVFEDTFGPFTLVGDKASSVYVWVQSDISKSLGFNASFDNTHVRRSEAESYTSEVFWKVGSDAMIKYSFSYMNIHGSAYQSQYRRAINRLQIEYNITDKFNARLILQPDASKLPGNNDYLNDVMANNLTLSWEYLPGSFVYFVYSKYKNAEESNALPRSVLRNDQSFVLKINKSLSL